jgi:hypothetical protein
MMDDEHDQMIMADIISLRITDINPKHTCIVLMMMMVDDEHVDNG